MFDFESYRSLIQTFKHMRRYYRIVVNVGAYQVMGFDLFGNQIIIDSRHFPSLKTLYIPSEIDVFLIAFMCTYIKNGMTCVDIGAGCGYYSLLLDGLVGQEGRVYSFESNEDCFELLKYNILHNKSQATICFNYSIAKDDQLELDKFFQDTDATIDYFFINLEIPILPVLKSIRHHMENHLSMKIMFTLDPQKKSSNLQLFQYLNECNYEIATLPSLKSIEDVESLEMHHLIPIIIGNQI